MDRSPYLRRDNWVGSYYELALEYYPAGHDERVMKGLTAAWDEPALAGPWPNRESYGMLPMMPNALPDEGEIRLFGELHVGRDSSVGCLTFTVREEHNSDWLDISIPTGMLNLSFPTVYPLAHDSNPWLAQLDRLFVKMAVRIFQAYPFSLGIIGAEVSGCNRESDVTTKDLKKGGYLVPPVLYEKLRPRHRCETLTGGLRWFPPTT